MKSVMKHDFSKAPGPEIQRSTFNRSHGYKTTFDGGNLIPVLVDEVLPGDTFNVNMTGFARLATPIVPIMDNMFMDTHFFSVPVRLVWENWRKFMGEQSNPGDSTDFTVPQRVSNWSLGSLGDYMGLPTGVSIEHSALFLRAYNLIWNEWFRDQNLQTSLEVPINDGPDTGTGFAIQRRGKRHDYFTSCLPAPQKGPTVSIPLGTRADVHGIVRDNTNTTFSSTITSRQTGDTGPISRPLLNGMDSNNGWYAQGTDATDGFPNIYADLSNASAATINQLREAFQIQKMYERDSRSGTRYAEIILGHFGVNFQDVRYRPEYLGGGSSPINVTPVPQTSNSTTIPTDPAVPSPQGNLAAYGTANFSGHGFSKSFTEHCIIIGLVSTRADLNYQQGINRMWSRKTRFDYYFPTLAHLGEQAVLNKEIFAQGTEPDEQVFGYQERFAEYRYKPSTITGLMRSTAPNTIDIWHLAQKFENLPQLDKTFIEDNPPIDRIIAVPSEPQFIFDSYFDMKCTRPMPTYSIPGLIDHF